jgi:hypothetical protein
MTTPDALIALCDPAMDIDEYLFKFEQLFLGNKMECEMTAYGWFVRRLEFWGWELRRKHGL